MQLLHFLKFRAGITIASLDISEQTWISRESIANTTSTLRSILEQKMWVDLQYPRKINIFF